MIEHPILFSAPMIRAILSGIKTQTRRRYKPRHTDPYEGVTDGAPWWCDEYGDYHAVPCPYGAPGDRLWGRETFVAGTFNGGGERWVRYRSTDWGQVPDGTKWKPSIFMPRWASRITLEVTAVRFQRLHDISDDDVAAEGLDLVNGDRRKQDAYAELWDNINGPGQWDKNPFVWAVTFKKI